MTEKTRRNFINVLIGGGLTGWLGSVLVPVFSFLKPPDVPELNISSVKVGKASAFASDTGEIIKFGRTPVLVLRTEAGEFHALSATCTHLDCLVQYRKDIKHIWCACHNGHYDLLGGNISGPPPRPLDRFTVDVVDDEIIVSKPQPVV